MPITTLEMAIKATREVLAQVPVDSLNSTTPCAQWNVAALIDHIVGGQFFFASAVRDEQSSEGESNFSSGDFLASFDEGSAKCLASFAQPGVLEAMHVLPFGTMPGFAFAGLAATDTFTHAWDLAKATGQSTDLAPELARQLLEQSRANISESVRNEAGSPFGFEKTAPPNAFAADELAAFLGREV